MDYQIDKEEYFAQFGLKVKMLTPDEAESLIGYAIGGVCPFGSNKEVTVYFDNSLQRLETVFSACGSSNTIKLSIEKLEKYSGYTVSRDKPHRRN